MAVAVVERFDVAEEVTGSIPVAPTTGNPQVRGHFPRSQLALLRDLERRFGPLETQQTRVGIGVATGADKVFITKDTAVAEEDRLIPLVMTRDIRSGSVDWGGTYLINPWARSSLSCRSMQGSARLASKHIRASMWSMSSFRSSVVITESSSRRRRPRHLSEWRKGRLSHAAAGFASPTSPRAGHRT